MSKNIQPLTFLSDIPLETGGGQCLVLETSSLSGYVFKVLKEYSLHTEEAIDYFRKKFKPFTPETKLLDGFEDRVVLQRKINGSIFAKLDPDLLSIETLLRIKTVLLEFKNIEDIEGVQFDIMGSQENFGSHFEKPEIMSAWRIRLNIFLKVLDLILNFRNPFVINKQTIFGSSNFMMDDSGTIFYVDNHSKPEEGNLKTGLAERVYKLFTAFYYWGQNPNLGFKLKSTQLDRLLVDLDSMITKKNNF